MREILLGGGGEALEDVEEPKKARSLYWPCHAWVNTALGRVYTVSPSFVYLHISGKEFYVIITL